MNKVADLETTLTSTAELGRQVIRKHVRSITLTPGEIEGKPVFYVAVEFELGGAGNSGVVLQTMLDASMQQYGFNTITATGLVLDTRVVRKRRIPIPNESAGDASAITASVSV